jgi:hypothetical protein
MPKWAVAEFLARPKTARLSKLERKEQADAHCKHHAQAKVNASGRTRPSVVREKESHARLYLSGIVQRRRESPRQVTAQVTPSDLHPRRNTTQKGESEAGHRTGDTFGLTPEEEYNTEGRV